MTRRLTTACAAALALIVAPAVVAPQALATPAAQQRQWAPDDLVQDVPPAGDAGADEPWGGDEDADAAADDDGSPEEAGDVARPSAQRPPAPQQQPEIIVVPNRRTIPGRVARIRRDGKAAIPRGAPKRVRSVIAAANRIVGRPYKWGGGHARLVDSGYDCSGAVGFALIRSGMLAAPRTSGGLARWGEAGVGRWLTVYANAGHVYLEVAGLRLDTSAVGDPRGGKGPRWRPAIGKRPGFHSRRVAQ